MADRGAATTLAVTDPTFAATGYTHTFPAPHVFGAATMLAVTDPAYGAAGYAHPTPAVHVFGATTAIYYGPW